MVISGQYLYVAERTTGAVVRFDLSAPTLTPAVVATGFNAPTSVVLTGGTLWVAENNAATNMGDIAELDPVTGAVTRFGTNPAMNDYYAPDLATSPGDPSTLFASADGLSPGTVSRIDVSTANPSVVATNPFGDVDNIEDLAVSYDGTRVIPAAGAPYEFHEYAASTMQPDGLIYPAKPYPSAVATSASGLIATGLDNGYSSPDISVFPQGFPIATFTATVLNSSGTASVLPHGLALTADGSMLFAITTDDVYGTNTIFNTFALPPVTDTTPPTVSCGSPPSGWWDSNGSIKCTALDVGTGLANPSDASFTLSTSVAAGQASTSAFTGSHKVCDNAGNCTTAGPLGPVEIDLAPPTISISSPVDGSTSKAKSKLVAGYSCADQGSGVASCSGPVANGAQINTASAGTFAFIVTATDVAGNKTTKTVHYTVKH